MNIIDGFILGTVQGLTEFLPVSSSGHLIVARSLFGLSDTQGLSVDAVLQLATVLAVGVYFAKDLTAMAKDSVRILIGRPVERVRKTLVIAVVLGTIPAVILGLLLEDAMDSIFRDVRLVSVTLLAGALLLWAAEHWGKHDNTLTVRRGVAVGFFQTLALVPGVSRSGATISGGMFMGLPRAEAARFSFLLAFPVILGSGLKKLFDLSDAGGLGTIGPGLLVGSIVAFAVGMLCIHFLLGYVRRRTLMIFVWYRIALALAVWLILVRT